MAGTGIGLHYLVAPLLAAATEPQNLMLDGVVSYFLTLRSINTEGKQTGDVTDKGLSHLQDKPHLYSRDPRRAWPSVVVTAQSQPLVSLRDLLEMAHHWV